MPVPAAKLKIAVVGAGVGGLTAARRLRDKGYEKVTVYEREATVGGKVCSYSHQGRMYELGALWSSPRYAIIGRFAKECGATRRGARLPDILEGGVLCNYAGYMRKNFRPVELGAAFLSLGKALLTYPGIGRPGLNFLGSGSPDSFERFSTEAGFGGIARMSASFFSGCGFLQNDAVPAPYLMKMMHIFIDVLVVEALALSRGRMGIFERGWQDLWQQLARSLDVRHSSDITAIRRREENGEPTIELTVGRETETYDRLVIASPLDTLGRFVDLREEERDLFSRVLTHRFKVTLVEAEGLPHASLMDHVPREKTGHISLVARQHADTDVFSIYQQLGEGTGEDEAISTMHEDVKVMGGRISQVITSKTWRYFPHVSTEDIRGGFYGKLERLQGKCGTFYVGSLMNMETVEHTAQFSVDLIDRKFS
ncbi:MAG TPA: FAD-dependent oxidoreductase [Opitutaceae bacterium]